MNAIRRSLLTASVAISLLLYGIAAGAQSDTDPVTRLEFLVGHWTCTSVQDGKSSSYEVDWGFVPGGRWMRGVNRSGTAASQDLITYDLQSNRWRTVDLEPDGSMSVLLSGVRAAPEHIATHSVYPDDSQKVTLDANGDKSYTLSFDFVTKGKHALWTDNCTR